MSATDEQIATADRLARLTRDAWIVAQWHVGLHLIKTDIWRESTEKMYPAPFTFTVLYRSDHTTEKADQ